MKGLVIVGSSKLKYKLSAYIYGKKGINKMLRNLGCNLAIIKNCYNPCKKSCKSTKCRKNGKF